MVKALSNQRSKIGYPDVTVWVVKSVVVFWRLCVRCMGDLG